MSFEVKPVKSVLPEVKKLRGEVKKRYEEAAARLRDHGCQAGGYRMRADDAGDAHVCCLRFYRDWRMHLLFDEEDTIWICFVGRHRREENIHDEAVAAIPGLSKVGRPREDQSPCCDNLDDTPVDQELVDLVRAL